MKLQEMRQLADKELFELLKTKHAQTAFDELYARYWEKLFSFALKIANDQQIAEDIIQEIFVMLWEKKEQLSVEHISSYLHQSVKFQVAKNIRKIKLTDKQEEIIENIAFERSSEDLLVLNELHSQIDASIGQLPPRCQEIFKLSRFESLSNQEIAQKLKISVRTVETQISIALRHLKKHISRPDLLCIFSFLFF